MLNITAAELEALTAHFEHEQADGFTDEVKTVRAALSVGDCQPTQDEYFEIDGMVHRSLERFEDGMPDPTGGYALLNRLAEKVSAYEESMYRQWSAAE